MSLKIYTKTGDKGNTSLIGGTKVLKSDLRIEAYGTVDELNAFVGAACLTSDEQPPIRELATILKRVQHELFNLGSILATEPADVHPRQPRITDAEVRALESEIDRMNADLPALRSFVLPAGAKGINGGSYDPSVRGAYHFPERRIPMEALGLGEFARLAVTYRVHVL